MVRIDAHFLGGLGHPVCQDYATAGADTAVVCDGCSSAPDTDVGARLLAHAALHASPNALEDGSWLHGPAAARRALGLPPSSLDATCIVARASDEHIRVTMFGDGVVAARDHDGHQVVAEVHYPRSAPPYPGYALDPQREHAYRSAGLGEPTIRGDAPPPLRCDTALCWTFPRQRWAAVLIGSDGLSAFRRADQSPYATDAVVNALFRYRSPQGAFVTRRLRKFVSRDAPRQGVHASDDVAVAALCWEAA